jgi:hypothetical protein
MFIQTAFNRSGSPFSLREKGRMRQIKSSTFADDFDLLTPTLSRREREKKKSASYERRGRKDSASPTGRGRKRQFLSRRDRNPERKYVRRWFLGHGLVIDESNRGG